MKKNQNSKKNDKTRKVLDAEKRKKRSSYEAPTISLEGNIKIFGSMC